MEKAAGDDEVVEDRDTAAPGAGAPAAKKKKRAAAPGAGICDDVLSNILARLPARSAVASMAVSKYHHALICSPEFRTLHCRLGAPLPRQHIAYVVNAAIRRRPEYDPVSWYYGFHVTGGGLRSNVDPMRVLSGGKYLETSYVNTCNGIVVLGNKEFSDPCRCILWNPAIADDVEEMTTFPGLSPQSKCVVVGLGCGRRSKTYKILLSRKNYSSGGARKSASSYAKCHTDYALLIFAVGDAHREKEARLLKVLSVPPEKQKEEINLKSLKSLYMDGTIYLLHLHEPIILAVDIDDERVNTILLPGEHLEVAKPELLDVSGRLCLVGIDDHRRTLWLLTADHQWERRCIIAEERDILYGAPIQGIWDYGDVLLLLFEAGWRDGIDKLCMYHVATQKMYGAVMPGDWSPPLSDYEICWGYRPTLMSPGYIVGELNQVKEQRQHLLAEVVKLRMPIKEQERRNGRELTLDTVCFMEFLVYIMRKLPHYMLDVIGVPLTVDTEETVLFTEHKG